jgi:purine-nucleoside phosphorylase
VSATETKTTAVPSSELVRAAGAARYVLSKTHLRPKVALVLGSGLGGLVDDLADATQISYKDIPAFPRSTVDGHAGTLAIGTLGEVPLAAMKGRVHYYEGYSAKDVAFPIRVFGQMGIRAVVLTNAAGAINKTYGHGALVAITDHINLQGTNPLIGPNDPQFGPRFPDMTMAYCKRYRAIAAEEAKRLQIPLHQGVYAAFTGPSYETPAEIRFLKTIGADLVGMSTVPETIAARHMGIRVLGISCVTNMAAGILEQEINHAEVMETGQQVREQFISLLHAVIPRIASDVDQG